MVEHRVEVSALTNYTDGCRCDAICRPAWRKYNEDRRDRLDPGRRKYRRRDPVGEAALDNQFWERVRLVQLVRYG